MIDAEIRELTPQATVAVRITERMSELDLGQLFGEHLPNIAHGIAERSGHPAGPPYGRYHSWEADRVDVEIGIPVAAPVAGLRPLDQHEPGEMGASELPGGPAVVAVHRGRYDTLREAYEALPGWIASQGRQIGGAPWESYVDDPSEVDGAELRTEVCWPLILAR
ncbi:MAG TPA: GyrI-like domain-containing protein [Candidatus Limnocylindria bacterium]|nr:GyrI-like domain-containing protein [Candidatus Limnocylindria bacterium]